ncbi:MULTISPECIES: NADP-dependent oxidoreductase [Actinomadura]|uniref:NADP-dependent oxidoreductase n=1 Tax=Actinomadura yumaensis TaxID=111807 RepID=A0ABW2CXA5_9ACTN|nr:NADP-dependent oxidoreductase [Actinomadura sp. J1-007]MWK38869.1 zinc-binding dehydrogenase [Actinomadura sp. J1-007]
MKAVVAREYGTHEVLAVEDVPAPRPGPGQILVRVRAASLNPADLRMLSGAERASAPLEFPHVPGNDFAGTVAEAGPGVTRFAAGDEVFGLGMPRPAAAAAALVSSPPSLTTGTVAEYAVFEADAPALALRPAGLDPVRAATLPTAGLTALPLVRADAFGPGRTVLVVGASGGVGTAAVPLLAATGAHVIATAAGGDGEHVRGLGAAEVIDYRAADTAEAVLERRPDGVDTLINLVLRGDDVLEAARAVRPGGRVLTIAFPAPERDDVRIVLTDARPGDLDALAAKALDGTLPPPPVRTYALDDAVRAYADLATRHTAGKLVVLP